MLRDTFLEPLALGHEAYQTPSTVISETSSVYVKAQNKASFHQTVLYFKTCTVLLNDGRQVENSHLLRKNTRKE